jgi:hypothetical protein
VTAQFVAQDAQPRYPCPLVSDKDAQPADPAADWWTMDDIAAHLGVKAASVRRYRARPADKGGLPPEDRMIGRTPVWKPATVITWNETERRGQGTRTDLNWPAGD